MVFADRDIVLVHPVARFDPLLGKADDLAELDDRLVRIDHAHRELVPLGDAPDSPDPLRGVGADIEIGERHRNIVVGVQQQGLGCCGAGHDF